MDNNSGAVPQKLDTISELSEHLSASDSDENVPGNGSAVQNEPNFDRDMIAELRDLPHLKEAAFEVINSKEYKSDKDQLLALLRALKITPEFSAVPSKGAPLLKV